MTVGFSATEPIDPSGHRERVYAVAILHDGRQLSENFPYDWTFRNPARDNPFYGANGFRTDRPLIVQRPPRGVDPRTLPPVIAFVLAHLDRHGRFHGRRCPPSGAVEITFFERVSEGMVRRRLAHATEDDLVAQFATVNSAGAISVCAFAANVGKKPVVRVRLRWQFKLRSETVTTLQDWRVRLDPSPLPRRYDVTGRFYAQASTGPKSCAQITNDPRLKNRVDEIEEIALTVLGVERAP